MLVSIPSMNPFSSYRESLRQTVLEPATTQLLFVSPTEHAPCDIPSDYSEPEIAYPYGSLLDDNYEDWSYDRVDLCVYHLTTTSYGCFVQYLLDDNDGKLSFLRSVQTEDPGDVNAISQSLSDERQLAELDFKGYLCFGRTLYSFFQSSIVSSGHWVTIDEICNARHYKSYSIGGTVTDLLISNPCLLTPGFNGKPSDIPVIGVYVSQPRGTILGNAFYFVLGCRSDVGQRCAIFLARCKVVSSVFDNEMDKSIGSQLAKLTDEISHGEVLKLIDCDGRWRAEYDSVIIGRIRLGSYVFVSEPMCAVKSIEQFICV